MKRLYILISGRVQGVFFRRYVKAKADELGITGWVRNTEDGKVEILAGGNEAKLAELLESCEKGPPLAEIEKVETARGTVGDVTPGTFQIKYSSFR